MRILGIDPGRERIGYGVVDYKAGIYTLVEAGLLTNARGGKFTLQDIKKSLEELVARTSPKRAGIEKLFFAKNQKTAFSVAEARGVIIATCEGCNIPFFEFTPNEVKLAVAGYGSADKKTVLKMVCLFLKTPHLKMIDDASDALAIAIAASGAKYGGLTS